jgi:hypothetical protein
VNHKIWHFQSFPWERKNVEITAEGEGSNATSIHMTLEAEGSQKEALQELWELSAAKADEYSNVYIKHRFQQCSNLIGL